MRDLLTDAAECAIGYLQGLAATQRVIATLQAEGTCWCGGTAWQRRTAMRISVSSWATTDADVERSLEAMYRVAADRHAP